MQDINTLKISFKHYSFSGSIHGKGGMKPKFMGPNFCYTIENISFWGCRKQEMVQSDRRMTYFLVNLRSGVLLIHGQERVLTSPKQLILIWDSISSKVHYHININGFILRNDMGGRYCAINSPPRTEWWVNCAIPTAHVVLLLSHTLFG